MFPKYCSISVLCIFLLIAPLYALNCYECEDCLKNSHEKEQCEDSQNACIKVTIGDAVSKTCINDNFCTAEKFEEGVKNAWHKIKNIFSEDDNNNEVKPKSRAFNCCYTDYCNSGNQLGNVFGTIGASFFLIGLMYSLN